MIRSFKDKTTHALFVGALTRGLPRDVFKRARYKLIMLNAADRIGDLRVPPGNRLEALVADRIGQHSIRVNDQFSICFRWTEAGPEDVEFTDYH